MDMSSSIPDIPKKRGRKPSGGRQPGILVRLQPEDLAALDAWIAARGDNPSRPEAVRTLIRLGMTAQGE